jgi:hypothetical protein
VSIDDCDTALAIKYGSQLGSEWACANASVQVLEGRYALCIYSIATVVLLWTACVMFI